MPTQNKFMKKYITWVVRPDHAYLSTIMADSEKDAQKRFERAAKDSFLDHFWDDAKFVHVPIEIQVPKELEHLVNWEFV